MINLERRKYVISSVDVSIEQLKDLVLLIGSAFPADQKTPEYTFKTVCDDLSEYESSSSDFLKNSGDLLKRKSVQSVYFKMANERLSFECTLKHAAGSADSSILIESEVENIVDSYFTKIDEFFKLYKRSDGWQKVLGFVSFCIAIWLALMSCLFGYWLFVSRASATESITFSKFLEGNFFYFMLWWFPIPGLVFYMALSETLLFPNVALLIGRLRESNSKIIRKFVWTLTTFILLTLLPGTIRHFVFNSGSPTGAVLGEMGKPQLAPVSTQESIETSIDFKIYPTEVLASPGEVVTLNFKVTNRLQELLRNVKITNESGNGLSFNYDTTYLPLEFIAAESTKTGAFTIELEKRLPPGRYKLTSALSGTTYSTSFGRYGSRLIQNVDIEVQRKLDQSIRK